MSDPFLRALIQQCSGHAERLFKPEASSSGKASMFAHIAAEGLDGKITMFACPMSDAREDRMFRIGVPLQLRAAGKYRHWCFYGEAWAAEQAGAAPLPREDPAHIDVIVFLAENVAGEQLAASRQVFRFPGQPARLLPLVFNTIPTVFRTEERERP